jgi:hypothetical protein
LILGGTAAAAPHLPGEYLYSLAARERVVEFTAQYRMAGKKVRDLKSLTNVQKQAFISRQMLPLFRYFFGPLSNRDLGSPLKMTSLDIDWAKAVDTPLGVILPYHYQGVWLLKQEVALAGTFSLPVPINEEAVYSLMWKKCGDSEPEHQVRNFYWYFWDPTREGCDQVESTQYQNVTVTAGAETANTVKTFPEYDRLIAGGLKMTLAFGYIEDLKSPDPDHDYDSGMDQYQNFLMRFRLRYPKLKEEPVLQGEYRGAKTPGLIIGHRFTGVLNGVNVSVQVVTNAGIDQMMLFAKSFAHDHDGLFGWFGHSRVGSGFDAENLRQIITTDPNYYSISLNYQLIYWAGCNSYSYYTAPFFKLKADAAMGADPNGTRNLDIIANGLPSLFTLNSGNGLLFTDQFLKWSERRSFQTLVDKIEQAANDVGSAVLAVVVGDEDNPL